MEEKLKIALAMCRDQDGMPSIMTPNYGIDVTFSDDKGEKYTTVLAGKRRLYVDITSYRGMSLDAIHYYCKIWFSDPYLRIKSTGKITSISGYFDRHKPEECKSKSTEIVRELTQKEIDDDPIRWEYYRAGMLTNGFESIDELKTHIDFVINNRFLGDWEVVINE